MTKKSGTTEKPLVIEDYATVAEPNTDFALKLLVKDIEKKFGDGVKTNVAKAKDAIIQLAKFTYARGISIDDKKAYTAVLRQGVALLQIDEYLFDDIMEGILDNPTSVAYPSNLKKVIDSQGWAQTTALTAESANKIKRDSMIVDCDAEIARLENKFSKDEQALREQLKELKKNYADNCADQRTKIEIIKFSSKVIAEGSSDAYERAFTFIQDELNEFEAREAEEKKRKHEGRLKKIEERKKTMSANKAIATPRETQDEEAGGAGAGASAGGGAGAGAGAGN